MQMVERIHSQSSSYQGLCMFDGGVPVPRTVTKLGGWGFVPRHWNLEGAKIPPPHTHTRTRTHFFFIPREP